MMHTMPSAALALSGLRVLELGGGPALAYAGKLFADLGAEVVKVEPPAGDPWRQMPPLVTVDGQPRDYRTPLAFVARSAYQLDTLGLAGAEAVRAGHFALFLAKGRTRWELMSAAIRLAFGRTAHGADFDLVISDDMIIESRSPRKLVALDGEKARMTAPFRLKVLHGGLRVCVPAEGPAA